MATLNISRKDILSGAVISWDHSTVRRECFGLWNWRLRLAALFMRCAARVLGVGIEVKDA